MHSGCESGYLQLRLEPVECSKPTFILRGQDPKMCDTEAGLGRHTQPRVPAMPCTGYIPKKIFFTLGFLTSQRAD